MKYFTMKDVADAITDGDEYRARYLLNDVRAIFKFDELITNPNELVTELELHDILNHAPAPFSSRAAKLIVEGE